MKSNSLVSIVSTYNNKNNDCMFCKYPRALFFFDVGFFFDLFKNFPSFPYGNFRNWGKNTFPWHHTSVANKSSEPYLWFFLVIAWIEAAVGKSYFLLFTEEGGCESLQKRKEHIRDSNFDLNNGLTKSRHPTTIWRSYYYLLSH